ncbi:Uncharacterised protein [Canicola haemoglobinophilus]|uniref:Uncharacterized protein n=1 Tax=Canicola haemoglobinophilus TaxID=733 RepID=A0A377HW81_9PAST|nr:hypothetical protein [Canicola haemoglobinophilus]STO54367.1 Uncharacterised protein [Canicola haemoglobinophilus]STO60166.1 Uncharacterised protein [Canicola haemoglobinophilus]STO68901.1 Uncharacterised protein [Canicola haemoglobinophilus]
MAEMIIDLSGEFKEGRLNTPFFKDVQYMNEDELKILFQFMQDVGT